LDLDDDEDHQTDDGSGGDGGSVGGEDRDRQTTSQGIVHEIASMALTAVLQMCVRTGEFVAILYLCVYERERDQCFVEKSKKNLICVLLLFVNSTFGVGVGNCYSVSVDVISRSCLHGIHRLQNTFLGFTFVITRKIVPIYDWHQFDYYVSSILRELELRG
jgi:hypothetical protein